MTNVLSGKAASSHGVENSETVASVVASVGNNRANANRDSHTSNRANANRDNHTSNRANANRANPASSRASDNRANPDSKPSRDDSPRAEVGLRSAASILAR